jgi:hypothetical protein
MMLPSPIDAKTETQSATGMTMDDYQKIVADLRSLERWQRIAFAAGCAERAAVIFRSFGSPESQALYEEGLELAWLGVTHEDRAPQANMVINKMSNAPEAEEGLTGSIYFTTHPLFLVIYALETQVRSEPDPVIWTGNLGLYFRNELDSLFEGESAITKIYPPGEMGPDGPLEKLELKHQRKTLELLKSAQKPDVELITLLRRLANEANKDLESVVSEIREGRL